MKSMFNTLAKMHISVNKLKRQNPYFFNASLT